jgi:hypothetical protein
MPDERAGDPHALVSDNSGGMWFTVQGGNLVGHLDKGRGEVRLVEMPRGIYEFEAGTIRAKAFRTSGECQIPEVPMRMSRASAWECAGR